MNSASDNYQLVTILPYLDREKFVNQSAISFEEGMTTALLSKRHYQHIAAIYTLQKNNEHWRMIFHALDINVSDGPTVINLNDELLIHP